MAYQLISVSDDGSLVLHEDSIEELFGNDNDDKFIKAVSVVGALRGGKSTMMHFLVEECKRLNEGIVKIEVVQPVQESSPPQNWRKWVSKMFVPNDDAPVVTNDPPSSSTTPARPSIADSVSSDIQKSKNFVAKWGFQTVTNGIWACLVKDTLFIDTQGMFDSSIGLQTTSQLFAITSLLSNLIIYNCSKRITEDLLNYLNQFSAVTNVLRQHDLTLPALEFLVRDWEYFEEFDGKKDDDIITSVLEAEEEYFNDVFSAKTGEMEDTRKALQRSYSAIDVALLNHPGPGAVKKDFNLETDGEKKLDPLFRLLLSSYKKRLFERIKNMQHQPLKRVKDIKFLLLDLFQDDKLDMPSVENIYTALSRSHCLSCYDDATRVFSKEMAQNSNYQEVQPALEKALECYDSHVHFGPVEMRAQYRQRIVDLCNKKYDILKDIYEQKTSRRRKMKKIAVATGSALLLSPILIPMLFSVTIPGVQVSAGTIIAVALGAFIMSSVSAFSKD